MQHSDFTEDFTLQPKVFIRVVMYQTLVVLIYYCTDVTYVITSLISRTGLATDLCKGWKDFLLLTSRLQGIVHLACPILGVELQSILHNQLHLLIRSRYKNDI